MKTTPINTINYKNVNFGAFQSQKKNSQNRAVSASDKALTQNTGLEMLSIINSATILAKKNNTSVQDELNKMNSSFAIIKKMNKDPKAAELTGKILTMQLGEENEHDTRINSQKAIIEDHVAFLSDILKNRKFIGLRNKALKTADGVSGNAAIKVEAKGLSARLYTDSKHGNHFSVAQTENTPKFDYYFSNANTGDRVKITNYLTNDCTEEYTYFLDKNGRLNTSAPIKVRQYDAAESKKDVITSYAWNKEANKVSVYCTDALDRR